MTYLSKLKQLVLSLIFIYLVIFSAHASALSEQCHHVAKILDAKANNYSELVDTNRFNLNESPFSQAGQDNVEASLALPSAEKCQVTWVPEQSEFSYMCDWKNQNKDEASTNLTVIGDVVEMCLVESDLAYDRVNPKSTGNLSFITFYFAKETNLKIVLMKMGSRIKSSFEFSQNQLVKPRSQVSENGKYDPNVVWPELVAQSDKEKLAQNQAQKKTAAQAPVKQQQALVQADTRKPAPIEKAPQQHTLAQVEKNKPAPIEKAPQKQSAVVNESASQVVSVPVAKEVVSAAQENTAQNVAQVTQPASELASSDTVQTGPETQAVKVANDQAAVDVSKQTPAKAELVVTPLDPNMTRCWYFASYTSAYQDQNAGDQRAYEAVLISRVNYIDVAWTDAIEQSLRQNLSQQAEQAWQTRKPADSYFYYNSQAFGHLSCAQDAQERIKAIRETMKSADWVGEFEAALN